MGENGVPRFAGFPQIVDQVFIRKNIFSGSGAFHGQIGIGSQKSEGAVHVAATAGKFFVDIILQIGGSLIDRFFDTRESRSEFQWIAGSLGKSPTGSIVDKVSDRVGDGSLGFGIGQERIGEDAESETKGDLKIFVKKLGSLGLKMAIGFLIEPDEEKNGH